MGKLRSAIIATSLAFIATSAVPSFAQDVNKRSADAPDIVINKKARTEIHVSCRCALKNISQKFMMEVNLVLLSVLWTRLMMVFIVSIR